MYLLSVCIPTYNREKNLKEMLDSIKSHSNVEIVVCDDGSTDNTNQLVNKYLNKLNLKYVYQNNTGVSAAMQKAYNNASGVFVIKMDSDDLFINDGLEYILETIKNNSKFEAFLYGVQTLKGNKYLKNLPPDGITNFISVRADKKVKGDLKEVVKREIVLKYMYDVPSYVKRIPPGLLWVKIAEDYECLSFNKAVAIKNYSYNEWFFPSHFEDDPNVPGFIQIESLVQTFIMTFLSIEGVQGNKTNFLKINNAVFKKKIVPGDVTTIYAHLESFKRGLAKGKAHSEVDGEMACSAEFLVSVPAILDKFKPKKFDKLSLSFKLNAPEPSDNRKVFFSFNNNTSIRKFSRFNCIISIIIIIIFFCYFYTTK